MALRIYDKQGAVRAIVQPSETDRCERKLMGDCLVSLTFDLHELVRFSLGDYIDFEGNRYCLLEDYTPEMLSTVCYRYALKFYGDEGLLRTAIVLKPTELSTDLSFAYYATGREHLELVVRNMNRATGSTTWTVGTVEATPSKSIDYTNRSCLDALSEIANIFELEWWIEGRTINLSRCEHGTEIRLGYATGLVPPIAVSDNSSVRPATRLYPLGSTRNIDREKYGRARLGMPAGRTYVEANTHLGIIERAEEGAFKDIYPRYTGSVSSVRTEERQGTDGKVYTVFYFKDDALPFVPNDYELPGLIKHIVFQSGELNGHDFETNYDVAKREWELITQFPHDGIQLPGHPLVPKSGDSYIPYNFRMPDEYIRRAEIELEEAAIQHMSKISQDTSIYRLKSDYVEFGERNLKLRLGQRITIVDAHLFATRNGEHHTRITSISQRVNNPNDMDLECSYAIEKGRIASLESGLDNLSVAYRSTMASLPTILRSWDSSDPSENNVFSAIRSILMTQRIALRKDADDRTAYSIGSTDYLPNGLGWLIKPDGAAAFASLKVSGVLEVDEFRRNRISLVEGEHFFSSASATVVEVSGNKFRPAVEEGDMTSLVAGDYVLGKWTTATGQVDVVKALIERVDADGWVYYSLAPSTEAHPRVGMHLAQIGHRTDARRQRATMVRHNLIVQYQGVQGWDVLPQHITALYGDLDGYNIAPFGELSGSGVYLRNAYISGELRARSADGTETRVPVDKGLWTPGTIAHPYDQFERAGRLWRWEGATQTETEPSVDNGWIDLGATSRALETQIEATQLYVEYSSDGRAWHAQGRSSDRYVRQRVGLNGVWSEAIELRGEDNIIVQVWSEHGTQFLNGAVSTTLYAFVYRGREEISSTLPASSFRWYRRSQNPDTDRVWNSLHTSGGRSLTITQDDVVRSAMFLVDIDV